MADVMMPHLGVSVTEGTLSTWLKQVGDPVAVGEPICEVSTDKVDTEIESTVAGVLTEQLFAEGDIVPIGVPLARVGGADEAQEPTPEPVSAATPEPEPVPEPTPEPAPAGASAEGRGGEPVRMPHLGVSVTEGTLSSWLKQVGDSVAVGEPICEVSTDKVDTEIESTVAGVVLEHRCAEGDVVPVGEPLAIVGVPGAVATAPATAPAPATAATSAPAAPAATEPSVAPPTAPPGTPAQVGASRFDHVAAVAAMLARGAGPGRLMAAPSARRLARDLGVDLSAVRGTGAAGQVRREDVQRHATDWPARTAQAVTASLPGAPTPARAAAPQAAEAEPLGPPPGYEDVPHEVVPTSRIRRVTAEHMTRSRRTAAHMTTEVDVDLGLLTSVRADLNSQRARAGEPKLSFLPFIARATCAALLEHPDLNATFQTEQLVRWGEVNLGIAVDTPRGLMVPVVRGAERLTLEPLARAIVDVAARVRDGKAGPDDFRAGTFTISNPGSVGAVSAPAIINQPQVGILGMPTIVRRPWVVTLPDGQETIAIRPIIRLALTFDHRAVDGADATRCLVDVKRRLESWTADDYR